MNTKRRVYTCDTVVSFGGVDFEATVEYDVHGTPRAATLTDPPEYLEVDATIATLTYYTNGKDRIALPPGVFLHVGELPADVIDNLNEACAESWSDHYSPEARRAAAAEYERESEE